MTLAEIIETFPDLFYHANDVWWAGEAFMHQQPKPISEWLWLSEVAPNSPPISAVDLAAAYVANPERDIWRRFLWTDDVDRWGSRVYVGGVGVYGIEAFQIHRHLQPACYWVRAA